MSKLLNSEGKPIKKEVDPSQLPTTQQILKDPITKKFVFLESKDHPDQTCIGITDDTDYHGVVYKYGQVTIPDETQLGIDVLLPDFDFNSITPSQLIKQGLRNRGCETLTQFDALPSAETKQAILRFHRRLPLHLLLNHQHQHQ